ncbi:MAG: sensor histidine kinase [Pirellulales bacterium]|nr:sensor histidine kinase [Pirellulales bacterium]
MTHDATTAVDETFALNEGCDLQTILCAWHAATVQLEQTHEALRAEVRRLTDELEEKNRELARKNRLADLGRMASHVAHEVRNSLVPVTLYLSLLRRRVVGDPGSVELLGKMEAGFTALDATVHDLLHFTSDRDPRWRTVRLGELVGEVVESLAPQLAAQAIRAAVDVPDELTVSADREMLRRALLNLALNALDAMPRGGTLAIRAISSRESVELEVADTGEGLPEGAAGRVFEPFFTTKSGGTGLGLAIVSRIADVHGGRVRAENRPRGGAAFTITISQTLSEAAA